MNTDKMRQVAYETAIANADELFSDKDKTPLTLAAGIVASQFTTLLAAMTHSVAKTALAAAAEAEGEDSAGFDSWSQLFKAKLKEEGSTDELLDALGFTKRYIDELAKAACGQYLGSPIGEATEEKFGASFGRN